MSETQDTKLELIFSSYTSWSIFYQYGNRCRVLLQRTYNGNYKQRFKYQFANEPQVQDVFTSELRQTEMANQLTITQCFDLRFRYILFAGCAC